MSDADATTYPPLSDGEALYRAVLKPNQAKNDRIRMDVFMRRPPHPDTGAERDQNGLSVALANGRDEDEACEAEAAKFNLCRVICRVFVRDVRALGLDAVRDAADHANVVGLPAVPPPDIATPEGKQARADAERAGGKLAERAQVVWRQPAG